MSAPSTSEHPATQQMMPGSAPRMLMAMQLSYVLLLIAVFADTWFSVGVVNAGLEIQAGTAGQINPWFIGLLKIIPLLLFGWAVITVKRKILVGFCMVLCLYFAAAIVDWLTYQQLMASAVALLSAFHFVAIGMYLKRSRPAPRPVD